MKKLFLLIGILALSLAACSSQATQTNPGLLPDLPTPAPAPTHIRVDLTPAQRAAIASLSVTLNLPADKITLISTEAVTWPNGCMGIQKMGVMCTQNEVPGFKIILEANAKQYEFHTNQDGSVTLPSIAARVSGPAVEAVQIQLASSLGIDPDEVSLVSDAPVEFPDACLGVAMQDVMCAQVITPGRIVVLEANGIQYEYHTNEDGSRIQPATLALTWVRSGGIAGFCDNMTVFLSGEIYANSCHPKMNGIMGTLSASERDQLNTWLSKYGQASADLSDPAGVADGMTRTANLFGNGSSQLSASDQQVIYDWAQSVFQRLNK